MRAAVVVLAAVAALASGRTLWHQLDASYTFDRYCEEFGKRYEAGSSEYSTRKALFDSNLARIMAHNQDTTKTWKVHDHVTHTLCVAGDGGTWAVPGACRATPRALCRSLPAHFHRLARQLCGSCSRHCMCIGVLLCTGGREPVHGPHRGGIQATAWVQEGLGLRQSWRRPDRRALPHASGSCSDVGWSAVICGLA